MAKNSIIHITPTTCHMLAKLYTDDSPETEVRWLRIGLLLFTIDGFNNGSTTEEDLHGFLDLVFGHDNDDNLRTRAYEFLS